MPCYIQVHDKVWNNIGHHKQEMDFHLKKLGVMANHFNVILERRLYLIRIWTLREVHIPQVGRYGKPQGKYTINYQNIQMVKEM